MSKKANGFTIVELLIAIVVIGILAAISIVAYNNIQQRAKNSSTAQAVSQWVRILNMYKADGGNFPTMTSCLGSSESYGHGISGTDSSGPQCRQDTSGGSGISVNTTFMNQMSPHIHGSGPSPAIVVFGTAGSYPWFRGAYYYPAYTGSAARIDFVLQGASENCPDIGGAVRVTRAVHAASNTIRCSASLEETP